MTTVALTASAYEPIDELKRLLEAVAVAIVSDDGRMLHSALPAGVSNESFAMMSATIVGAAATVSSDLKQTPPDHIVIRGVDFTTILSRFDGASLLIAVVGASVEPDQLLHRIDEFIVARRPRVPSSG
ncbi:MAG: roadblock/LC7 domain-containing protein [Thermoplasmata archaeon]|nr:roadblock/LC7 domain-containing protein [Thermoplasmata archaeon]